MRFTLLAAALTLSIVTAGVAQIPTVQTPASASPTMSPVAHRGMWKGTLTGSGGSAHLKMLAAPGQSCSINVLASGLVPHAPYSLWFGQANDSGLTPATTAATPALASRKGNLNQEMVLVSCPVSDTVHAILRRNMPDGTYTNVMEGDLIRQ